MSSVAMYIVCVCVCVHEPNQQQVSDDTLCSCADTARLQEYKVPKRFRNVTTIAVTTVNEETQR